MSWLFSRALGEAFSADICSDGEPCALWSGTHMQQASWLPVKTTKSCSLSRSGVTYRLLTDDLGEGLLMSYLVGFRAKTSPVQVKEQDSMENEVVCGSKCLESQRKLDQSTSSLKTALCYALEDLSPSCKTLPKSGTMRNGQLWEHQTLEQTMSENECGYLLEMWPTPRCQMTRQVRVRTDVQAGHKSNLEEVVAVRMGSKLPTGGYLNPVWTEWLMGWPIGWTDLKPLEMDKYQRWLRQHGKS